MADAVHSYSLKKLEIVQVGGASKNYDLKSIFKNLVIYHSIDEISNSGYVEIQEQGILPLTAPLVGWERLDIEFKIEGSFASLGDSGNSLNGEYKRSFFVYAIDNLDESSDVRTYIIRFADLALLINNATRIEKRYKGRAESIIQEICNIKSFQVNPMTGVGSGAAIQFGKMISTNEDMDFIASMWKPLNFCKKIASMAQSSGGAFCDCVLYQQIDGKYEFNSYRDILNGSAKQVQNTPQVSPGKPQQPGLSVLSYKFDKVYNSQAATQDGVMGSVVKVFDLTTMKLKTIANYYSKSRPAGLQNSSVIPKAAQEQYDMIANYSSYGLNTGSAPVNRYTVKNSPVSNIYMTCCGANQESQIGQVARDYNKMNVIKSSLGRGDAMQSMTHSAMVTIEFNPNVELRVGDLINISYSAVSNNQKKVLQGRWWIGDLKYSLTLENISVTSTCYSNSVCFDEGTRLGSGGVVSTMI